MLRLVKFMAFARPELGIHIKSTFTDLLDCGDPFRWDAEVDVAVIAPPVGSWSRSPWLSREGPRPARGAAFPLGQPGLQGAAADRVDRDTRALRASLQVMKGAAAHNRPFLFVFAEDLGGRAILWFFDNLSALTAMTKSGSPVEDSSELAMVGAYLLTMQGARAWFEHVPSASNPSDPLSRDGFSDPWVASKIEAGEWARVDADPDWNFLMNWDAQERYAHSFDDC